MVFVSNAESLTMLLNIDCGATDSDSTWEIDEKFIKSGQNMQINTTITLREMTTLRFFPDGIESCYNLPLLGRERYLIRAGFYYGNYDGLSNPPAFDLRINGQYWTTINSTLTEDPIYVEMIYPVRRDSVKICLVRVHNNNPFISSLQARVLPSNFYKLMENTTILNLHSRIHFGGERDVGKSTRFGGDEDFNRIWKLKQMYNYHNVTSVRIPYGSSVSTENWPPYMAVADGISPPNGFNSISMWFDLPPQTSQAYFVFYFKEPEQSPPVSLVRRIEISINGHQMALTEVPQMDKDAIQVVSLYPVPVAGSANVTLQRAEGSTFPPIINAMEVFTSMELSRAELAHHYPFMVLAFLHVFGLSMLLG
ncbi:receptor-like protein kinase At3g21340 [Cornus florida]|uniref:receptor-like protein kinase At3g21340 n=1 Tax=Cornus florida TaxID=4283 RepID=UPI00289E950A|nr:receptor-like protein kinase At3g21340 [Cornus florida]